MTGMVTLSIMGTLLMEYAHYGIRIILQLTKIVSNLTKIELALTASLTIIWIRITSVYQSQEVVY